MDVKGKLEEVRLRNLQLSRNLLKSTSHLTDDELKGRFLSIYEDIVLISFILKRTIDPYAD